jgi:hypothetical protein
MRAPTGVKLPPGFSFLLIKALYGLHQSPRLWNAEFNSTLKKLGFVPTDADPCLYTMSTETDVVAIFILHVDDSVLAADEPLASQIAKQLMAIYNMTNAGTPTWVLGLGVDYDQDQGTLRLSQKPYIEQMLVKYGMEDCNTAKTPAATVRLTAHTEPLSKKESDFMKKVPYRSLVGSLLYAAICTRPDIAFSVIQNAKFSDNPSLVHFTAAKRILRYLKGTKNYGITYTRGTKFKIDGFVDSDWAGDLDTRRSTAGYVFMVLGGPVSWRVQLEKVTALSSFEAELVALLEGAKEALWQRKVTRAFGFPNNTPTTMFEDNQGCIATATNQKGISSRTKHIATRYFAVRQFVEEGEIEVSTSPLPINLPTYSPSR